MVKIGILKNQVRKSEKKKKVRKVQFFFAISSLFFGVGVCGKLQPSGNSILKGECRRNF